MVHVDQILSASAIDVHLGLKAWEYMTKALGPQIFKRLTWFKCQRKDRQHLGKPGPWLEFSQANGRDKHNQNGACLKPLKCANTLRSWRTLPRRKLQYAIGIHDFLFIIFLMITCEFKVNLYTESILVSTFKKTDRVSYSLRVSLYPYCKSKLRYYSVENSNNCKTLCKQLWNVFRTPQKCFKKIDSKIII